MVGSGFWVIGSEQRRVHLAAEVSMPRHAGDELGRGRLALLASANTSPVPPWAWLLSMLAGSPALASRARDAPRQRIVLQ
jgi:hypothetical protein